MFNFQPTTLSNQPEKEAEQKDVNETPYFKQFDPSMSATAGVQKNEVC